VRGRGDGRQERGKRNTGGGSVWEGEGGGGMEGKRLAKTDVCAAATRALRLKYVCV